MEEPTVISPIISLTVRDVSKTTFRSIKKTERAIRSKWAQWGREILLIWNLLTKVDKNFRKKDIWKKLAKIWPELSEERVSTCGIRRRTKKICRCLALSRLPSYWKNIHLLCEPSTIPPTNSLPKPTTILPKKNSTQKMSSTTPSKPSKAQKQPNPEGVGSYK